jgi:hypothetical protein
MSGEKAIQRFAARLIVALAAAFGTAAPVQAEILIGMPS